MRKIRGRSLVLLQKAWDRDVTVDSLLYTDRPPTRSELEALAASGCDVCSPPTGTIHTVRFRARDVNSIVNLGFVEGVEVLEP